MKYFNFLLENDINFKLDETGNYTALVKVFNPEYYKDKENAKNQTERNNFDCDKNRESSKSKYGRTNSANGRINSTKYEMMNKKDNDLLNMTRNVN